MEEAAEELERIAPKIQVHPDVLCARLSIYSLAKKWELAVEVARLLSEIEPDVSMRWIALAQSLHELKRTKEARDVLLPVADRFPNEYLVPYKLACYICQLGDRKEALLWLEKAVDLEGKAEVRLMALDERDLEPLWSDISEI